MKKLLFPEKEAQSLQSACIKGGNMMESIFNCWAKESGNVEYHDHDKIKIPNQKGKKQIDLAYDNKYMEMKTNIDFDTEKNPACLRKIEVVTEALSKIHGGQFIGGILVPTLWDAEGYRYFKKGQKEVVVGAKTFLDDIGLPISREEYVNLFKEIGDYILEEQAR